MSSFQPIQFAYLHEEPPRRGSVVWGLEYAWGDQSDAETYGGSGQGNMGSLEAAHVPFHGQPYSLNVTFPPLAVMFFKNEEK